MFHHPLCPGDPYCGTTCPVSEEYLRGWTDGVKWAGPPDWVPATP